jgi:hypothetical protein
MPDVNLIIHTKKSAAPSRKQLSSSTPYDARYGFEGMVTELHPENNTVHVRTPEGREISNVKVISPWVTIDKDKGYLSGKRHLPPIDTYVLVFMPNGEYSSAVIIGSVFSNDPQHGDFKEDSEDAKEINEGIENSGWKYTDDKRTGTRVLQNKPKDPTIKIEVDQEKNEDEKVTITIHGSIFTVDKNDGIKVETDKNIAVSAKGNATVDVGGDMSATVKGKTNIKSTGAVNVESSADITAKGVNATVEASTMLTLKTGDASAWIPNGIAVCPYNGIPHGGEALGIAKLKGG